MAKIIDNVKYTIKIENTPTDVTIAGIDFESLETFHGRFVSVPTGVMTVEKMYECATDALAGLHTDVISRTIDRGTATGDKVGTINFVVRVNTIVGEFTLEAKMVAAADIEAIGRAKIEKLDYLLDTHEKRLADLEKDFNCLYGSRGMMDITLTAAGALVITEWSAPIPAFTDVENLGRCLRLVRIGSLKIELDAVGTAAGKVPQYIFDALYAHAECATLTCAYFPNATLDCFRKMTGLTALTITSAPLLTGIGALACLPALKTCTITVPFICGQPALDTTAIADKFTLVATAETNVIAFTKK